MIAAKPLSAAVLLISVVQTAILGYMIEGRAAILRSGTEVLLKTAPVDPRDLLRGDYVILTYDISTIPTVLITGERPSPSEYVPLHIRLKPGADGFWIVSEASAAPLAAQAGSVLITSEPVQISEYQWQEGGSVIVSYGIERFYVPEGEGRPIEDGRNQGRVSVAVRVSENGQAQIRALRLDGEALYEEPLY